MSAIAHTEGAEVHATLQRIGAAIMPGVFSPDEIERARQQVLDNVALMRNTRVTPSSRHLAGFHRYPALEPLHAMMTGNPMIRSQMERLLGQDMRTIGLSDITINRSQQWHKDVLRGKYAGMMHNDAPCSAYHGTVFKVIVYLQDSSSLKVIPGSHQQDIPLDNDNQAIPSDETPVETLSVAGGDVVIIDICTTHRGSEESAFQGPDAERHPKILISTVFGRADCEFTDRMEQGNAVRLADWMDRHVHQTT